MRKLSARLLILCAVMVLAAALHGGEARASAGGLQIEPFVWQLGQDYPDGHAGGLVASDRHRIHQDARCDGLDVGVRSSPARCPGPAALQNLVNIYGSQGIGVAAWFVPKRLDFDTQLAMAEEVIDSGVTTLYADLEPFQGFCYQDCATLAHNLWARLRSERPNARLGVIYDPRPWWWEGSDTQEWLANADVALPMCYWDDFAGTVPFGDPGGCIAQAKLDLDTKLAPGRNMEYIPILQGDSQPIAVRSAMDAAVRAEATRVSLWRRGVVSQDTWSLISGYQQPSGPHCALHLVDGCLVREASQPGVYLIEGGAKFGFPSGEILAAMGFNGRDVQVMPFQATRAIPNVPVDGTLLQEFGSPTVWVVYGGARFPVAPEQIGALGLDPNQVRVIPPSGLIQIPLAPADYVRLRELSDQTQYLTLHGGRIEMDGVSLASLTLAGHDAPLYVVADGGLANIPFAQIKRGDADCDGTIGPLDVVRVMQGSIGVPNTGLCVRTSGDVSCDGFALATDALMVLQYMAGLPVNEPVGCPPVGEPQPASIPLVLHDTPTPEPPPTDTPAAAEVPSETPTAPPTESPTPAESAAGLPTASPASESPSGTPTVTAPRTAIATP